MLSNWSNIIGIIYAIIIYKSLCLRREYMKKQVYIVLFISILIIACSRDHHPLVVQECGSIPVKMNLSPAFSLGYQVDKVLVSIQKEAFLDSMYMLLDLENQTASGEFTELSPGLYSIKVKVFADNILIATGVGQGQVLPGQNSIVQISLQLVPGSLTVEVDWGDIMPDYPKNLLFIGNSYTYYNDGLWSIVKEMAESAHPEWIITTGHVTPGGYTLEGHYEYPETVNAITSQLYDLVILQEQSVRPVYETDLFFRYAELMNQMIIANNSKTAFYMTHARQNNPDMINDLADAYTQIGSELGALVCPAGLAWKKSLQYNPTYNLYENDGSHPNFRGSYLSACVIYAAIYQENPVGNTFQSNPLISESERLFLQEIAWETVCDYFGWPAKNLKVSGF